MLDILAGLSNDFDSSLEKKHNFDHAKMLTVIISGG